VIDQYHHLYERNQQMRMQMREQYEVGYYHGQIDYNQGRVGVERMDSNCYVWNKWTVRLKSMYPNDTLYERAHFIPHYHYPYCDEHEYPEGFVTVPE
jgi:hypothetical protein